MLSNLGAEQFILIAFALGVIISIVTSNWFAFFGWMLTLIMGLVFLGVI